MDTESQKNPGLRAKTVEKLPTVTIILFALQPLLDILSFWVLKIGHGNTATLLLRFAVFFAVALLGFFVSERKRFYVIAVALCAVFFCGHAAACLAVGYLDPVSDITNLLRVLQMPLFAFCFISFLRANKRCYSAIETGLILNFGIITLSVGLGLVTGTAAPTYQASGLGILGWFATTNAQSSIVSLLSPIVVILAFRRGNYPLFLMTSILAFAQLYFLGTRLAFLSVAVTAVGMIFVTVVTKKFRLLYATTVLLLAVVCLLGYRVSPMYMNQNQYTEEMSEKQSVANDIVESVQSEILEGKEGTEISDADREKAIASVYDFYTRGLVERFGVKRVMEKYNYSTTLTEITAVRPMKIKFCELLLEDHTFLSRIFGLELARMTFDGYVYDVENDFHGIFFLYGWVGLAMMVLFLGYFIMIILKCLIKDFKKYFTLEAGAFGIAFCLCLGYAYLTAGVLRRPNSSFYLSVVLAAVYYLINLRKYDEINAERGDTDK